jgi:hypothetical protein
VFGLDKQISFLTGRPPALSHQYCKFKLPLDLSDEVLMQGGESLRAAIEKLDANGWNTEGQILVMTTSRANILFSVTLNEILELSLGHFVENQDDRIRWVFPSIFEDITTN